jgi:hypothetical protein
MMLPNPSNSKALGFPWTRLTERVRLGCQTEPSYGLLLRPLYLSSRTRLLTVSDRDQLDLVERFITSAF